MKPSPLLWGLKTLHFERVVSGRFEQALKLSLLQASLHAHYQMRVRVKSRQAWRRMATTSLSEVLDRFRNIGQ